MSKNNMVLKIDSIFFALLLVASSAKHVAGQSDSSPDQQRLLQLNDDVIGVNDDVTSTDDVELNERPIIAVLSQELSYTLRKHYGDRNYSSYIGAAYVKCVEMAGARVVPVLINQPDEYYDMIFNTTNGLLIPGGSANILDSGYQRAAQRIFERAVQAFDSEGDIYPIWGTCLGFELLAYFTNDYREVRTKCWSQNQALHLNFTEGHESTRLMSEMPREIVEILKTENVTINFHRYCVSPETFANESNSGMRDFWTVISTNHDDAGNEFISLFESKNYSIWGSQFHPEKNMFEWAVKYDQIPHFEHAVDSATYFANFFVQKCRQNQHKFASREEEEEYLIYNFNPTYTGKMDVNYSMQQCYFFH